MVDFAFNDYIWYIIGGVALLFILIGFIADKTGLAKKAFSKENQPVVGKKDSDQKEIPTVAVSSNINYENQNPIADSNHSPKADSLLSNLENSHEEEHKTSEEESVSDVSNQATIYLNDTDVPDDKSVNELEKAYLEAEKSTEEAGVDDTLKENTSDEDSSIATEDAESDWGISSTDIDNSKSSDEMQLPNLEDLNADEDVWKF